MSRYLMFWFFCMLQDASSLLYLRTAKIGTWSERPHRKEGQKKELVATVVQLERTKSKRYSPVTERTNICFCWWLRRGVGLLHCSMDDFSKVNETRIKVLSSHPSAHVEVRCPRGKKTFQWLKALLWCCCKWDLQINNSTRPRLSKLDRRLLLF